MDHWARYYALKSCPDPRFDLETTNGSWSNVFVRVCAHAVRVCEHHKRLAIVPPSL